MAGPRGKGGVALRSPPYLIQEMYTVSCRWLVKETSVPAPGIEFGGAPSVSGCHCSFWDGPRQVSVRKAEAGRPSLF